MKLRFAPSPTGYLHVGNARIALANALTARRAGGHLLLRLDDTDRERSRPEYEDAIRQDLAWLGIGWDSTFRQMDRLDAYDEAADKLRAAGRLYPCFESEEELRAKRELMIKRGKPPVYDRAMLRLTPEQRASAEAGGKKPYWRFKLSDGEIRWNDLVLGTRTVKLGAVSDPVLIRADGTPLYTFTSVVDDIFADITHIVRGEDHITNTGVQIDIFRALRDATGGPAQQIQFAHLPLLVDGDGGKLSKRLEGLSLRSLRQDGMEAAAITAYLARLGTSLSPEILPFDGLAAAFDLKQVSRSSARFDMTQLLRLNSQVLHAAPYEAVRDRLPPGATEAFWNAVRGNLDLLTEARHWWDVVAGEISPPALPDDAAYLSEALDLLPNEPWTAETWSAWTKDVKARTGKMGKGLFMPLRLALTGEPHGPELAALLPLIGRARAEHRLRLAGH
jgi:glutamyl-tRNA synthetase